MLRYNQRKRTDAKNNRPLFLNPLVFGSEELVDLRDQRVCIRAVDGDVFEESNFNRQLLGEMELLGKSKAEAAKARIARINPDVEVQAVEAWLTEENAGTLISGCDAVQQTYLALC